MNLLNLLLLSVFSRKAVLPIDIRCDANEVLPKCLEKVLSGTHIYKSFAHVIQSFLGGNVVDFEERAKVLQKAKANIMQAQENQKKAYDCKHFDPHVFKVGMLVLKKDFTRRKRKGGKLDPKWLGPYKIVATLGRGLYQLEECASAKVVARVNGTHSKNYNPPNKVYSNY